MAQATTKNKSFLDDAARRKIAEKKLDILAKSSSKFIKFDNGETKILQFVPPYEGQDVEVDFQKNGETKDMTRFLAYDITNVSMKEQEQHKAEPLPWDVGTRNATQLLDLFENGSTLIEIKRIGAIGDKNTTYRMNPIREQL